VVLLVGHQPSLGQAISLLLGLKDDSCPVRKGAVWWIRTRERDGDVQTLVLTVQTPELL
jgi:phosphohistidine phosphatase